MLTGKKKKTNKNLQDFPVPPLRMETTLAKSLPSFTGKNKNTKF